MALDRVPLTRSPMQSELLAGFFSTPAWLLGKTRCIADLQQTLVPAQAPPTAAFVHHFDAFVQHFKLMPSCFSRLCPALILALKLCKQPQCDVCAVSAAISGWLALLDMSLGQLYMTVMA